MCVLIIVHPRKGTQFSRSETVFVYSESIHDQMKSRYGFAMRPTTSYVSLITATER